MRLLDAGSKSVNKGRPPSIMGTDPQVDRAIFASSSRKGGSILIPILQHRRVPRGRQNFMRFTYRLTFAPMVQSKGLIGERAENRC